MSLIQSLLSRIGVRTAVRLQYNDYMINNNILNSHFTLTFHNRASFQKQ